MKPTKGNKEAGKMTKAERKAKDISEAIARSECAKAHGARAYVLDDGSIQYSMTLASGVGKAYEAAVPFSEIVSMLEQPDLLRIEAKYGRGQRKRIAERRCVELGIVVAE
jgi:hypothetical protein